MTRRKAPTKVPTTRSRRSGPRTYVERVSHPLAPSETAEVTFRYLRTHEVAHVQETRPAFAAMLALVKLAIVDWTLKGEPAAMLDLMHRDTVEYLYGLLRAEPSSRRERRRR